MNENVTRTSGADAFPLIVSIVLIKNPYIGVWNDGWIKGSVAEGARAKLWGRMLSTVSRADVESRIEWSI